MNQLVKFNGNRPLFKDGTCREEIFASVPRAEPSQILSNLGMMFSTLASREDMPDQDKQIRNEIYAKKLSDYPNYAIEAAVTKFIDEEIFVPAVSELVKEVRDQVFKKIIWTDKIKRDDPFDGVEKWAENKRAEFVKQTIKNVYGNQEGAPTGSTKPKATAIDAAGAEKRAAMERLKATALEAADMENAVPLNRVTIKQIKEFVISQDWKAPKATYEANSGTITDLEANRRTSEFVIVRQAAMFICKNLTVRSFPEIGRNFGGRDHTTVLHANRKIQELVDNNQFFMNGELFSLDRLEI